MGNIGNGKNYQPGSNLGIGYEYELYPKSHPVLKNENYNLVLAKFNNLVENMYYFVAIPCTKNIIDELKSDKQYQNFIDNLLLVIFILIGYLIKRFPI